MTKTVLVPIADGIEEIEAVCIIDTLRRSGAQITVAAVDQLSITASRGVKLTADALLNDCSDRQYDLIVLPGGMPGAEHLRDCKLLIEMLNKQKQQGRFYGAICASPAVVLGHYGLLDNRCATCYPAFADKLVCKQKSDAPVVIDENCITSQGPGTALDFAITLIKVLFDDERAEKVAAAMLIKS